MYDIIIIGAGPAGLTAALYALRAEKKVLIIEKGAFGGQMTFSPKIENYPGFEALSGNELAEKMMDQVIALGAEFEMDEITGIEDRGGIKRLISENGSYEAAAVIIAAGAAHRRLGVEGEEEFTGSGVSFCAVCDGAFYKGQRVVVVGGGNSALQEALLLSELCSKVVMVQNLQVLTGEQKLAAAVQKKDNIEIIYNSLVTAFKGENTLSAVEIQNGGEKKQIEADGAFVAVGLVPQTGAFKGCVELDESGYVKAGESCESSASGIFVAGDCRTKAVRQISTAAADGAVAALAACKYINERGE